ncbi:glycosyltransferase family 2 protein [Devosia alba]|uniref:glycosyltransferase family 2 protein n=1 Tax=Devosia alba TaxID=3152360 RepID=UPI0032670E7A
MNAPKTPVLTLVTVTKNCATSIEATLRSVAAIKQSGIEYIVVDGVSIDGTIEKITATGPLVDTLISEPDTGIYNAMNKAVSKAKGHYIAFINGDDELISDGFGPLLAALQTRQSNIVCGTTLVGSKERPDERLICEPWKLLFHNSVPHPSSFVSRDLLTRRPFREDLKIASDYDFFLGCFLAREHFVRIDANVALHQRGGASSNARQSELEVARVRREKLGWLLPLADAGRSTYRTIARAG